MTSAAAVFCCTIALAFAQGFGSPAFVSVIAADAIGATLPLIGVLVVARFAARRLPAQARAVERAHCAVQGLLVAVSFGWWWVEPHAALTSITASTLAAMAWQAAAGAIVGLMIALASEGALSAVVMREIGLGAWVLLLAGGGRVYRSFDHIESGIRMSAAAAILATMAALALGAYLLLRRRPRVAAAIPALAPPAACAILVAALYASGPQQPASTDSVLLVVVDTLRADIADGQFAADPQAMPELARIAGDGVRFTQAVSPAPWTLPATVSLLSGWNPHRHRYGATASDWEVTRGDPAALYLASALRDRGYLTSAFVNNPWLRPYFGLDAGFYTLRPYHGRAIDGIALTLEWLRDHLGAPSFTLLHLMDPHWPFEAPPGYGAARADCHQCESLFDSQFFSAAPEVREELARRYASEARFTDAMLGRFYDTLVAGGALESSWFIVTSDHGEEFWEHGGFLHGHSLYDELLRVPLIVVPPRSAGQARRGVRVDAQVRLEDVAATIGEIAGLDPKQATDGISLLGLIAGKPEPAPRPAVAGYMKAPQDFRYAVRQPPWKSVVSTEMGANQLFNLSVDSGEQRNLLFDPAVPPLRAEQLSRQFLGLVLVPGRLAIPVQRSRVQASGARPDSDSRRALRSLGYAE